MNHIIERLAYGKFKIQWEDVPDSLIMLDFNPLINAYNLNNKAFVIEHWQAKPIGLRRWGLFDSTSNTYHSLNAEQILVGFNVRIENLQINELIHLTKPTAVKLYRDCQVVFTQNNRIALISKNYN